MEVVLRERRVRVRGPQPPMLRRARAIVKRFLNLTSPERERRVISNASQWNPSLALRAGVGVFFFSDREFF